MTAANVDFIIDKGTDWAVQLYWTDYANTPYVVQTPMRMEIRAKTGQVMAELFIGEVEDPPEYETILHNSESGLIQLQLPASVTDTIPAGEYEHDLFVTYEDKMEVSSLRLHRLIFGKVIVRKRVTQVV